MIFAIDMLQSERSVRSRTICRFHRSLPRPKVAQAALVPTPRGRHLVSLTRSARIESYHVLIIFCSNFTASTSPPRTESSSTASRRVSPVDTGSSAGRSSQWATRFSVLWPCLLPIFNVLLIHHHTLFLPRLSSLLGLIVSSSYLESNLNVVLRDVCREMIYIQDTPFTSCSRWRYRVPSGQLAIGCLESSLKQARVKRC
jgi:hypothetical protein